MRTAPFRPCLLLAMAAVALTLPACAHSPGADGPDLTPPTIATNTIERLVCPADLDQDLGDKPRPAAGAVVDANDLGLAWIAALGADNTALRGIILDARAACAEAGNSAPPRPRPPDPG